MIIQASTIGVCVVTYQEAFSNTQAFSSLRNLPLELRQNIRVVSFCNSPTAHMQVGTGEWVKDGCLDYLEVACDENTGLAGGYNYCLSKLLECNVSAVLFLNSDSFVPANYMEWLINSLNSNSSDVGYAPLLYSRKKKISPFNKLGIDFPFYIISYLCLRFGPFVRDLSFPNKFWLDGIDYWLSAGFFEKRLQIKIAPFSIQHNLSVSDEFRTISVCRFKIILSSERLFLKDQGCSNYYVWIVYARAILRCIKYWRLDLAKIVISEIFMDHNE